MNNSPKIKRKENKLLGINPLKESVVFKIPSTTLTEEDLKKTNKKKILLLKLN